MKLFSRIQVIQLKKNLTKNVDFAFRNSISKQPEVGLDLNCVYIFNWLIQFDKKKFT